MVIPPTSESVIWEAEFKAEIIMPEHTNLSKSGCLSKSQFPYQCNGYNHVTFIRRFIKRIKRNLNITGDKSIEYKTKSTVV